MYIMKTPSNIRLSKDKKKLTITFDEIEYPMSSEFLRVYSPSAEVQGHGPGQETLQLNKENVEIEKLKPTGNYAIAIHYSDSHSTGIYSWNYLYHLAINHNQLWSDYCQKVNDKQNNNVLSLGFDIQTGGHVFQLHFSNSPAMIDPEFITQTNGEWLKGDIYFGFNISRVFTLNK